MIKTINRMGGLKKVSKNEKAILTSKICIGAEECRMNNEMRYVNGRLRVPEASVNT